MKSGRKVLKQTTPFSGAAVASLGFSNSSLGIWQITRQSLRYAHELFLCDTRDYSKLPLEFRPTQLLDMNFLSSRVLTTYAALLLRDLLDYFDGSLFLASAA